MDLITGGWSLGTFKVPITVPKPRRIKSVMMFLVLMFSPEKSNG